MLFVKIPKVHFSYKGFLFVCLLLPLALFAQQLSGTWSGTGNWGVQNFDMRLELEESGEHVTAVFSL